jgi:hypothetical protein
MDNFDQTCRRNMDPKIHHAIEDPARGEKLIAPLEAAANAKVKKVQKTKIA